MDWLLRKDQEGMNEVLIRPLHRPTPSFYFLSSLISSACNSYWHRRCTAAAGLARAAVELLSEIDSAAAAVALSLPLSSSLPPFPALAPFIFNHLSFRFPQHYEERGGTG